MSWIIKSSVGGRGGSISTDAIIPETGEEWGRSIGLDIASDFSDVFRGGKGQLDLSTVPRTVVVERKRQQFPDIWWGENKLHIISEALHEIIEDHDPGLHIIWPVEMQTKRGEVYPGPFFAFVPGVHAAAIDEDESDANVTEETHYPATATRPGSISPKFSYLETSWDAVVKSDALPDCHIWWDHGLTRSYLLTSDALHDAIKTAGRKVIPMKKVCEIGGTA
ncbi:MAG: DUF1629 domain-containing protein [Pseudomonadota bacterium]